MHFCLNRRKSAAFPCFWAKGALSSELQSMRISEFHIRVCMDEFFKGRIKPGDIGRPPNYTDRPYHRRSLRIQCFPVYSLLLALGNPTVDYFSLDIEGAEYPVLKTIPFDKVSIQISCRKLQHMYVFVFVRLTSGCSILRSTTLGRCLTAQRKISSNLCRIMAMTYTPASILICSL